MPCHSGTPESRLEAPVGGTGGSLKFVQQTLPVVKCLGASPAVQELVVEYGCAVSPRWQARTRRISADAGGRVPQYEEATIEPGSAKGVSIEEAVLGMSPN